ncbi:MAG: phosphohistidine phosphatase [Candidatus Binatota bacterium]|jgi:phosphohistidine phosphatase|nr:phosphohistidine phosphatase [Candidatus Binatota bacterium]
MRLYVVRHAIAEERATGGGGDAARALTEEGRKKMERATAGLAAIGVRAATVLTSPIRRARETAEILARGLGAPSVEDMTELSTGGAPPQVLGALRRRAPTSPVAIVGHQPTLGALVSLVLTGSSSALRLDLKKGAVVCLELDFAARSSDATLLWMLAPKQLRHLR